MNGREVSCPFPSVTKKIAMAFIHSTKKKVGTQKKEKKNLAL